MMQLKYNSNKYEEQTTPCPAFLHKKVGSHFCKKHCRFNKITDREQLQITCIYPSDKNAE